MKEKNLEVYDVWESPNGNLFIKISDNYSITIGAKGCHEPNKDWGDLSSVKKVGKIIFD